MISAPRRLVVAGSVIVDLMTAVPHLPERGSDVLAGRAVSRPGGGFNVLTTAARLGLPAALAGRVGTGPLGSMIGAALDAEGIEALLPRCEGEQGCCVGMTEPDGQSTFVTMPGVESRLSSADLDRVALRPGDVVYVSGYDLLYPEAGPALVDWLRGAASAQPLFFDPGPLVAEIPDDLLDAVLARLDVLGLTTREMTLLSGCPVAASALPGDAPSGDAPSGVRDPEARESEAPAGADRILGDLRRDAVVLLRDGARGSLLVRPGRSPVRFPPYDAGGVVDTTGAGDVHTGAFLAELARGADVEEAARAANVAAALSTRVAASAGGPAREALDAALSAERASSAGR